LTAWFSRPFSNQRPSRASILRVRSPLEPRREMFARLVLNERSQTISYLASAGASCDRVKMVPRRIHSSPARENSNRSSPGLCTHCQRPAHISCEFELISPHDDGTVLRAASPQFPLFTTAFKVITLDVIEFVYPRAVRALPSQLSQEGVR
jgi:hypothetical protein